MNICASLKTLFKKYMLAGTAILVPLIGTYLILKFIIVSADEMMMSVLPTRFQPQALFGHNVPGLGLIATLVLIFIVGILTRLYIGNLVVSIGDKIISKIPLGRSIYGGIKQFMSSILTSNADKFRSVVAVEYPRRECWVLGFLTSDCEDELKGLSNEKMVNVFVPTTPNPTSGFLIMVPVNETKKLDMKIDEAFKLLISGGIIKDDRKALAKEPATTSHDLSL